MEKKINWEIFSGEMAVLWPRGSTGAAKLKSALVPHIPGWAFLSLSGRKEYRWGAG